MTKSPDTTQLTPILFVAHQTGVAANGGIASLDHIIRGLTRYRPIILTNRNTEISDAWRSSGLTVFIAPIHESGARSDPLGTLRNYSNYYRMIGRIRKQYGVRLIHANDPLVFQLSIAIAKRSRLPLCLNLRDTIAPGRKLPRLRYLVNFSAADHVFYLSDEMATAWTRVATQAKSFSITYSVCDAFNDAKPSIAGIPPCVLVAGSVRPDKGQLEFLRDAAPIIAASGIGIDFAGDFKPHSDPYARACANAAEPLGSAVSFLGYRKDMAELYQCHRVTAIASHHEGLARAMIETMAQARPVASVDVCSAREILEQKSGGAGKVVGAGNLNALANEIVTYCKNPEAAQTAGQKGLLTARELFARSKVISAYEKEYDRLVGGSLVPEMSP
jgi:glycosyltransferase involved in cell wall biosynthesis